MKKKNTARATAFLLSLVLLALMFTGCAKRYTPVPGLNTEETVSIKIAIPNETDKALTLIANSFMKEYPNVNVSLEYMEDYETNAVEKFREGSYDIIFARDTVYAETQPEDGAETQVVTSTEDYYYNFYGDPDIGLSSTNDTVMANYTHIRTDGDGSEVTYLYSLPLGGEVRGVFVNKTLLDSLDLAVPTNYAEFLHCCQTLQDNGYIPIQGNPSTAGRCIGMSDSFRDIVNDPIKFEKLKNAEEGVSQLFTGTFEKLHDLAALRYYDYKRVEEEFGMFKASSEAAQAMNFLGLSVSETFEITKPENNYGTVAFFPFSSSAEVSIEALIEDNALDTEVVFICPPLNEEGENSTVYFTPYYGICANKNSENLIWLREFVHYLITNIKEYADMAGIIPNSPDAIDILASKYGVDKETDCVLCGEVYFSDQYNAYDPVSMGLVDVVKCSAPKYMVLLNKDAAGEIVYSVDDDGREYLPLANGKENTAEETKIYREYIGSEDMTKPGYAFCTPEYYLNKLEGYFAKYR